MSTLKVDTITTISGTGNINLSRPIAGDGSNLTGISPSKATIEALGIELPAANLTGTIHADRYTDTVYTHPTTAGNKHIPSGGATNQVLTYSSSGTASWAAPAAGDKRNFIIDGDFTQWPEGTAATSLANLYTSALWKGRHTSDGTATWERSTDVPTVGDSSHESEYSMLIKCTGTDASLTGSQRIALGYAVTGSDFTALHQQEVTLSFWAKTAAANTGDTYSVAIWNGGQNRNYIMNFTPTSSWAQYTFTWTGDTGGTYNFDEDNAGLKIYIALGAGPNDDDATALETWEAGNGELSSSASPISNFMDSASNEFYITQVGLYLGSSAPTFTSPSIATVVDQVEYYVEKWDLTSVAGEQGVAVGACTGTSTLDAFFQYKTTKRGIPSSVTGSAATTFRGFDGSASAIPSSMTFGLITPKTCRIRTVQAGTTWTIGNPGYLSREGSTSAFILVDARH